MTEGAATEVAAVGTHCGCADLRAGDFTETKGREGPWEKVDKRRGHLLDGQTLRGSRLLFAQWTRC